jgi:hypothetical protein
VASAEGRSGPRAVHVHGLDFERIRHHGNAADLAVLKDLIEAGKVRPLIDRAFSLADVPEGALSPRGEWQEEQDRYQRLITRSDALWVLPLLTCGHSACESANRVVTGF